MVSDRASQRAFFDISALLFAASAAATSVWCTSMSAMGEMPMLGGWTVSMAWMPVCGQTWPGAAASFLQECQPPVVELLVGAGREDQISKSREGSDLKWMSDRQHLIRPLG
jgi:hypothetical protein